MAVARFLRLYPPQFRAVMPPHTTSSELRDLP
jgi:hypothetical protein